MGKEDFHSNSPVFESVQRIEEIAKHRVDLQMLKIPELDPNSHKGSNGRLCIVGGSPLFHGAGQLAAMGAYAITTQFASITNDGVYFCSTSEVQQYLKAKIPTFIGINRDEFDEYLPLSDVILLGPGMMREPQKQRPETFTEPQITTTFTQKALESGKKVVLDAGSLQILTPDKLTGKENIIITPHRQEMSKRFGIDVKDLVTTHASSTESIAKVAERVQDKAKQYNITVLLKGPVDIIANKDTWFYSPGGNEGMTKGGTGDVLAGVVASLYSRIDDPLLTAATGSYIMKRTGELLYKKYKDFYNAEELAQHVTDSFTALRQNLLALPFENS